MPFESSYKADVRLVGDKTELTEKEVRDLFEWLHQISESGMRRLNAELALQNLKAVQKFEQSSSRLTKWLIVFTVVLTALTLALVGLTVMLVYRA